MTGFVARLEEINALADQSAGFVWRLQTPEGDATALRPWDDDLIIVNMSVWEDLHALREYVYRTAHAHVMRQRRQWFERFEGMYLALWWIPREHLPTIDEAKARLDYLRQHGPTEYAFTFTESFLPPDATAARVKEAFSDWDPCPA
jgi:hypothetical protein